MNLYLTLGLRPEATVGDIKRAFRRLARKYHPNINPGDQAAALRFQRIVEAYETLVDPDRRRRYDQGDVAAGPAPATATPFEFEGFDFSVTAEGASASTFGDLFADVFRAIVPVRQPTRGVDLHARVKVPFDASMRGASVPLAVTRFDRCDHCHGGGVVEAVETRCPQCRGAGEIRGARGHMVFTKLCPACEGAGLLRSATCPACRGETIVMRGDVLAVQMPPGVQNGEQIRIPGQGNAGRVGGPAGDLYLTVDVEPHPLFRREGQDLHLDVPVALHEMALGARIEVPTPSGPCKVTIPPGAQPGQRVRVRERGVPSPREGQPGDLIVTLRLVLPQIRDERSKELIRELARLHPDDVRAAFGR